MFWQMFISFQGQCMDNLKRCLLIFLSPATKIMNVFSDYLADSSTGCCVFRPANKCFPHCPLTKIIRFRVFINLYVVKISKKEIQNKQNEKIKNLYILIVQIHLS